MIFKCDLNRHFEKAGYKISSLEEIHTSGATQCQYFSLLLRDGGKRFIKIGEKVDFEIRNLNYLAGIDFAESPRVLAGSNSERKILVMNYATIPSLGYDMIRLFNKGSVSIDDLLVMQEGAFDFLGKLYLLSSDKKILPYPQSLHERVSLSLAMLRNLKGTSIIDGHQIDLSKIVDIPICITDSGSCPISIRDMCLRLRHLIIDSDETSVRKIIHADFQPPNIVGDENRAIRVIDFTDMVYSGNPCWDLGKWSNYIKRFHRVAELRALGQDEDRQIIFHKPTEFFFLEDKNRVPTDFLLIEEDARRKFRNISGLSEAEIVTVGLLSEFIVNVYTLNRHCVFYPHTIKNVLMYIRESYQKVVDQI